ncbi:hypothetical protein FACS1894201_10830 [Bacteroidia bacterium]|nr:hypothetical protein FACS1894201_10830 [Bacteroidia bacterium]
MRSISVNIIAFSYSSTHERRKVSERDIVNYEYFGYDAWGRRYKYGVGNVQIYFDTNTTLRDGAHLLTLFTRGYTGHEHLDMFGLINMNGRLYDPAIGRMLSPDPYVQAPTYTQSFNRYSYCLNNPLKYTDPSGKFFVIDSWIVGFFKGLFTKGECAWTEANKMAGNDAKIWGGLFASDPNKKFLGRTWEVISRLTWQAPQTVVGFLTSHAHNTFVLKGGVGSVDYKYGATVLRTNDDDWGGFTLGSYIIGDNTIKADANNSLFQHEYGHYIQSQKMGWAYLSRVGIPSLISAAFYDDDNHDYQPFEQDANRRAFMYFNKNVDGFYKSYDDKDLPYGWNFYSNPLDVYHVGASSKGNYYDYNNSADMSLVNSLSLSAQWQDYFFAPFGLIYGIGNGLYYNKYRVK